MKLNSKREPKNQSKIEQIVPSIVLEAMTIEGDIFGEGALEVDGKVYGNIRCLSLSVGVNGVVHGDIVAEKVEILGEVVGDMVARKIICGATAKVKGDILHSAIHVENGAYIDGSCRKFVAENIEENIEEIEALGLEEEEGEFVDEAPMLKPREPEIHQEELLTFGSYEYEVAKKEEA
jgi:cytoskeletal protein CcmA (bactofilin family)